MTRKTRFINKLGSLSANEKNDIITFFSTNPVYESLIDWNNKNLKSQDFEEVFALSRLSRRNRKNSIEMFKNYNCKIIVINKEYIILVPLDSHCAEFLTSHDCGGEGARWCIGSKEIWNHYIRDGIVFYFLYFFQRHPVFEKKLIIQIDKNNKACFFTQNDTRKCFKSLANFLAKNISFAGQGNEIKRHN